MVRLADNADETIIQYTKLNSSSRKEALRVILASEQFRRALREFGQRVKKLEYIRFPLRLGKSVFRKGKLGKREKTALFQLMSTYKQLINLYQVDAHKGCATSAIREAKNGRKLIEKVNKKLFKLDDFISEWKVFSH